MSQLDCIGSGDKSQRQKKGPGSLAERKAQLTPLGEDSMRERRGMLPEEECALAFFIEYFL